jgi:hypothetical protein
MRREVHEQRALDRGSDLSASSASAAPSSNSSAAPADVNRLPGQMYLTDREDSRDAAKQASMVFSNADDDGLDNKLYVMDIEVHSMQVENKFVSQITCIPLDGDGPSYNAYVFLHRLKRPWMDLVQAGQVELAKWDDEHVAHPFPDVWRDLCEWLPQDALLLFKGRSDLAVIELSLNARGVKGKEAIDFGNSRGIKLQSIDALWWDLCKLLPSFAKTMVFGKRTVANGSDKFPIARPLRVIYDALFWNPLLIKVEARREELLQTEGYEIETLPLFHDQNDDPMPMEFLMHKHLQPVWHTSHTDTLATRHITVFLMLWIELRDDVTKGLLDAADVPGELLQFTDEAKVSSDDLAFCLLSTCVARLTNLFRSHNLHLPGGASAYAHKVCFETYKSKAKGLQVKDYHPPGVALASSSSSSVVQPDPEPDSEVDDDDDATIAYDRPDDDDDIDVYRILDDERLHSTDRARIKVMEERDKAKTGLAVKHRGVWVLVHKPRNRDATRLRAAKVMLGIQDAAPGAKSRYDVLEEERRKLAPLSEEVRDRPWYYYPTATGSQGAGVQVLHTRRCLDRRNGNNNSRARAAPATSDKIALYQFDQLKRVIGYRLKFCKECKQYETDEVSDLADAFGGFGLDEEEEEEKEEVQLVHVHIIDPYLPALQTIFDKLSTTEPITDAFRNKRLKMKQSASARIVFASVTTAMGDACHKARSGRAKGERMLVVCSQHSQGLKQICDRIAQSRTFTKVVGIQWNAARTRYAVDSVAYPLNRDAVVAIGDFVLGRHRRYH